MHGTPLNAPGPTAGPPSTHLSALEMLALVLGRLTFREMLDLAADLNADREGEAAIDLAMALHRWSERMGIKTP